MSFEEILNELRKYYPFGVPFMDERYCSTKEFKFGRQVHNDQYAEGIEGLAEANDELSSLLNSEIDSYFMAAGHFCHHYTFYTHDNRDERYYSLLISTIIPFYTIRILDTTTWESDFSSFQSKYPEKTKLIEEYIARRFPGYQVITDNELLTKSIDGVEVDLSDHPSLLNLAFTTILA
ncbi:hypothetical protein GQF61_14095 [Sphingobacterium sp. DK4209]|uniref:Uncharacterized protein n=1 Tax=Sphingobacterium zhuxiongii TaxID=2662364 RepID=A0A5Q0QEI8_9SPHI|nr:MULTISPECIES: hypothetical protein [unclassified Sphingobacterium]MVZ66988.1 hypothetical protein [Sphingobacterium sp. DK4209]QGA25952.1 hypothetical protein GFH32_06305 [Sphingobacterium sp. dk4302]